MTSQPQLASADLVKVPARYWEALPKEAGDTLQRNASAESHPKGLIVRFLNEELEVFERKPVGALQVPAP